VSPPVSSAALLKGVVPMNFLRAMLWAGRFGQNFACYLILRLTLFRKSTDMGLLFGDPPPEDSGLVDSDHGVDDFRAIFALSTP